MNERVWLEPNEAYEKFRGEDIIVHYPGNSSCPGSIQLLTNEDESKITVSILFTATFPVPTWTDKPARAHQITAHSVYLTPAAIERITPIKPVYGREFELDLKDQTL